MPGYWLPPQVLLAAGGSRPQVLLRSWRKPALRLRGLASLHRVIVNELQDAFLAGLLSAAV